jgi:hypothetical protein
MSDYSPENLSRKWKGLLPQSLEETSQRWALGKPRKRFFSFKALESDLDDDQQAPRDFKTKLLLNGEVVWGLIARSFFAAYVPGRNTHYGSVVYSVEKHEPDSVFELAWRVNELRKDRSIPPKGTEAIANAMRDDTSGFARLRLPVELDAFGESYLANLCIHRTRLPGGYLHDRLLPILIAPKQTEWCCILPLRFWSPGFKEVWLSGPPAYEPSQFSYMFAQYKIQP